MRTFKLLLAFSFPLFAGETIYDAFESDGFGEWKAEGKAFGKAPVSASPKELNGVVQNYSNDYYVTSSHGGDHATGYLTSPEFIIKEPYIAFLVSGGPHKGKTSVQLLIDGAVVRESTGQSDLIMRTAVWPVSDLKGKKARIRIVDSHKDRWGIINADHFIFTDFPSPKFPRTTTGGTPHDDGLVATNRIPGLLVPKDSHVRVFSDYQTHGLYSPTALSIDEKGHVYVVETHRFRDGVEDNRNHLYWLIDDMASQTTDDRRALHEKWKHKKPLEDLTSKEEKIRVLVDTNGDAKADQTKIFAAGFNDILDGTAAGIMALEGKIYFACIPNIWTLEDENGDLVADTKTILQDGFGVRVSFSGHDLNGFALGPDGRIYCTIGDRGFSFTTKEGRSYRYPGQGAILRFDLDGKNFQVVHTGLRNPKEIAFDNYGTAITVDNNSDQGDRARVVFMMEGADSGWRMGHQVLHSFHKTVSIPDRPINMWMQERMWQPQNEAQPAFIVPPIANLTSGPSGLAYAPGSGYDFKCENQFLICDYRGSSAASGIWRFGIKPQGAGFALSDSGKFNWGVAATDLEWGYDGRLYVSDFISGWVSHAAGRIYSLAYQGITQDPKVISTKKLIQEDFAAMDAQSLADLLGHHDQRIRLRAQLHLTGKKSALPLFAAATNQRFNEMEQLHGLWGLGIMARRHNDTLAMDFLVRLLEDPKPIIRAQAVKALGDTHLPNSLPLLPLLLDPSPRVQALTALALSKHPHPEVFDQLIPLIEENNDRDPFLRHAASLCLAANGRPEILVSLRNHPSASVRLSAVIALRRLRSSRLAQFLIDEDPRVADEAIRAIHDLPIESARPALAGLLDDYASSKSMGRPLSRMMMQRLIHSAFRVGRPKNVGRLIKVAANPEIHAKERLEALRLLECWPQPPEVDQSTGDYAPLKKREITELKAALIKDIHHLFETDNIVLGKTLAIASQYGLAVETLDTGTLTRLVRDKDADALTRSEALKLLLKTSPEDPSAILTESAQSNQDLLANTALKLAAKRDPEANVAALKGALSSDSSSRRQTAWTIIGALPAEHAVPLIRNGLEKLKRGKADPESMLEILEAARSRKEPAIKSSLAAYEDSLDKDDPLAKWLPTLAGGDPANGKKLFTSHGMAQCMRCHRTEKGHSEGGEAGPNLMGVALRHDARGLLESLVLPNAKIAPRFGMAEISLKNGVKASGLILAETETSLDLKEGDKVWRVDKATLSAPAKQLSAMPSMEHLLNPAETRDIIAWLLTLTKESGETHPAYEIETTSLGERTPSKTMSDTTTSVPVIDPAVMEAGKKAYMICMGCHGMNGEGMPNIGPPLSKSEWVNGPAENLIRIQMRGLEGPIEVNGQEYNFPAPMMAMGAMQSDENVASVLTYIRNSFGNSAPAVTSEMVAAYRSEIGKPLLTVKDLVEPIRTVEPDLGPLPEVPSLDAKSSFGASIWGLATTFIIGALCATALLKMKMSSK